MRLFIVLLLAALSAAQYQQRRHYGYQNPYQYHPYMRYHNYNHPTHGAQPEEPVEQQQHEEQQPAPRHHPYHQARRYQHGYERQHPAEPATTPAPKHHHSARQPHHYSAYQQRPAAPHHAYGRYQHHRPAAAAAHPQHNSVEPVHEAKPAAAHEEERGEPVYLGTFKNPTHEVKGDIFMLDDHTLYIQGFSFDGQAPDVYFWSDGIPIPYYTRSNNHVTMNVHEYKDEDIVLMLPPEKPTLDKMRKFQVWCKQFGINFGEFSIDG